MTNINRWRHTLPGLACIALLAACAQPPKPEVVRICDSAGCSDRPADSASFDADAAVPDPDPDGRIAALEALARDDPRAAYDLGLRFFRGDGVRQDSYKALQWMRDAAERGDLNAQKAVGRLYLTGLEEMGSDPREAEKMAHHRRRARRSRSRQTAGRGQRGAPFGRRRIPLAQPLAASGFTVTGVSGYPYYWRWRGGRWYYYY